MLHVLGWGDQQVAAKQSPPSLLRAAGMVALFHSTPSRGCFHGSRRDASFSACIPAKAASTPRNGRWTYYNYRAPMAAPGFPLRPPSPTAEETRRDGTVRASFPIVTPGAAVPTSSSNRWRRALLRRRGICCSRFGSWTFFELSVFLTRVCVPVWSVNCD